MTTLTGSEFYVAQSAALRRGHARLMTLGAGPLRARYTAEEVAAVTAAAEVEFDALIPAIPYVGGRANSFTDLLIQATSLLALYRVLKLRGRPVAEIGAIVHAMAEAWVNQHPGWVRRLMGHLYMSQLWRARLRRKALASQARQYPGDFVYAVVPGDDQGAAWGVDYLECGLVKYLQAQGADEFAPYMCVLDFLLFPAMGIALERQGTLAQGCARCDFRFHSGGAVGATALVPPAEAH